MYFSPPTISSAYLATKNVKTHPAVMIVMNNFPASYPPGTLYIYGGGIIALEAFLPVMELLKKNTFHLKFVGWFWYSLVALGGALIFLALCRPTRETAERKLFF